MPKRPVVVKDDKRKQVKLERELEMLKRNFIHVGVQGQEADTKYDDADMSVVQVAVVNEFGRNQIPSRPFMRQSFDKYQGALSRLIKSQYNAVLGFRQNTFLALKTVGVAHEAHIKAIFATGNFEPNAPSTIKQKTVNNKKGNTPLIDTGRLRQSITYTIKTM